MNEPRRIEHPLYKLLQEENIPAFNAARTRGESVNLSGAYLRGLDLRGMDARGLDLSDAYLRSADLRGIDFRETRIEGASLHEAKISGVYFPVDISAHEIFLSVDRGTRLRAQR